MQDQGRGVGVKGGEARTGKDTWESGCGKRGPDSPTVAEIYFTVPCCGGTDRVPESWLAGLRRQPDRDESPGSLENLEVLLLLTHPDSRRTPCAGGSVGQGAPQGKGCVGGRPTPWPAHGQGWASREHAAGSQGGAGVLQREGGAPSLTLETQAWPSRTRGQRPALLD